jgi:hypothetical protein
VLVLRLETANKAEHDLAGLENIPWKAVQLPITLQQMNSLKMTLFAAVFLHMLLFHSTIPMVNTLNLCF